MGQKVVHTYINSRKGAYIYRMINTRLLQSQMTLKGVSTKDLADAQGWSMSTAYRKINGKVAFTIIEVQKCVDFLGLSAETASAIFFATELS